MDQQRKLHPIDLAVGVFQQQRHLHRGGEVQPADDSLGHIVCMLFVELDPKVLKLFIEVDAVVKESVLNQRRHYYRDLIRCNI